MIFLDHAATSPLDSRLLPMLTSGLAMPRNASSVHRHGQKARAALEGAREAAAEILGVSISEVVFTSGASESNNMALRGLAAEAQRHRAPFRVLRSDLEHACVRETSSWLAATGAAELNLLPVLPSGQIDLSGVPSGPSQLLCLMAVQNETGVVQPLAAARDYAERHGLLWLCDATQAVGLMDMRRDQIGWDLLSCSSHKIGGPPGVGLLAGPGLSRLEPLITGGPQESERRAGTQPVALIVAFVEALRLAVAEREQRRAHLALLEESFFGQLAGARIDWERNGEAALVVPGYINVGFPPLEGADLVIGLDARGFSVSSGAACATGVMEPSPALRAMFPNDEARTRRAIRITPGSSNEPRQLQAVASAIAELVSKAKVG
ncbi:aminotransferase class V-fold PLP-dependent enzyme [bacterium]|nr:aminotransferase class V-fold PLP-dependent enzyme [bacterium]